MRRLASFAFLAALVPVVASQAPATPPCDARAELEAILDCRIAAWSAREPAHPASIEELESWLDDLVDAPMTDPRCVAVAAREISDECDDAIAELGFDAMTGLATHENPVVRQGGLVIAFLQAMEGQADAAQDAKLEEIALRMLDEENDDLTLRAVLRLAGPGFFRTPRAHVLLLRHASEGSELRRALAASRLIEATGCSPTPAPTEPRLSAEQLDALRRCVTELDASKR